jgi:Tol biopolymer transport system component
MLVGSKFTEQAPALAPDGRFLAYTSNETGRSEVYVVPFPNAAAAKWPVSSSGGTEPRWSHNGRELFYLDGSFNLVSVPVNTRPTFSAGTPRTLFSGQQYLHNANHQQYDVSPDDKRFLMIRPVNGQASAGLIFVENWFEELKANPRK